MFVSFPRCCGKSLPLWIMFLAWRMSGLVSVTAEDVEGSCSSRAIGVADHEDNLMVESREPC